jgi:hypothetical protein
MPASDAVRFIQMIRPIGERILAESVVAILAKPAPHKSLVGVTTAALHAVGKQSACKNHGRSRMKWLGLALAASAFVRHSF